MMILVGYDNFIKCDLVAAILKPDSSPVKKLRQDAAEKDMLINATSGHKTRSVVVLSTGQVVLASIQPATLKDRVNEAKKLIRGDD